MTAFNVSALIDKRMSRYQLWIVAVCFLISLVDGLDSQIMSVTGPVVAKDLGLAPSTLGPLLSASQWGALVGAFTIGLFADRWGRRKMLLASGLLFSAATLATAWADTFGALIALRFITGVGIGGAVPCFFALAAEYAPERKRASVVAIILGAVPCGGILAGLLGAGLLSHFSWQVVYQTCGALSLLVNLLIYVSLPESLSFMISRKHDPAAIRSILKRLAPREPNLGTARFVINEEIKESAPVKSLLTESRARFTIPLWAAFFLNYLVLIGTLVWTPTLMKQSGMSIGEGALALTLNNVGGIIGIALAGPLFDRFRSSIHSLIAVLYVIGAVATTLLGYTAPNFAYVVVFSALAGFAMAAGLSGLYALSAIVYPTFMRSTGLGWGSGFGRVGSSTGPLVVGALFAAGWSVSSSFVALALIALASASFVLLMSLLARRSEPMKVADPVI